MAKKDELKAVPGLGVRIAITVVTGLGWLMFVILFLAFWVGGFTPLEAIAVFLISILAVAVIVAPMWIMWGMKVADRNRRLRERMEGRIDYMKELE